MSKYRIWCRVSGGTREAWLKTGSGNIYETSNKAAAQKRTTELNSTMGRNTMVRFHYEVREV